MRECVFVRLPRPPRHDVALRVCVQPAICHVGIHVLQAFAVSHQYPFLKDASCRIIRNVSKHPRNRTLIYASELSQKVQRNSSSVLCRHSVRR